MVHERLSHFLNEYDAYMKEMKNKDNNYNEKEEKRKMIFDEPMFNH